MMISTRGRYALRVMLDLAEHSSDGYIPMNVVATRQQLSLKYLEQILPVLSKNNLIEGVHGKGGGYKLVRSASKYTVGEILRLTEGSLAPVTCLSNDKEPCMNGEHRKTLPLWTGLNKVVNEYLDGITLDALLNNSI